MPVSLQLDQGSNFMPALMQQVMDELGMKQYKSSVDHRTLDHISGRLKEC